MAKAKDKPMNQGLGAAKAAKQDEFYTQYVDIQNLNPYCQPLLYAITH